MASYRISHAAQADITAILAWSEERFGVEARLRYEALVVAALRDAAAHADVPGAAARPELGEGVFCWHLRASRPRSRAGLVHQPRHLLVCRLDGADLVVGRVLHDAMDLARHVEGENFAD